MVSEQNEFEKKASETPISSKRRTKVAAVECLDDLISAVYSGQFKRTTLRKKEIDSLKKLPSLTEHDQRELYLVAQSDQLLDRTRQLMLLGIRIDTPGLSGQIREFCREVLGRHTVFEAENFRAVLSNLPEALTEDQAISKIQSTDFASLHWREGGKPLKKKQYEQCRTNATHCLLLLFWGGRGTSMDKIHQLLQINMWSMAARKLKTDADRLYALLSSRDTLASAVVFNLFQNDLKDQKRRAETAVLQVDDLSSKLLATEEQLSSLECNLTKALTEINRLETERKEENQAHALTRSHLKDDFEKLKGQVLGRLKNELALLDEGLHALRRDPPKVHVMIDHAERAIDGLKAEMEKLRENYGNEPNRL